jgi:hypothetical protein
MHVRVRQRVVENGNRKMIGLWLHQNARVPTDTVFLEPLGYIGYFSQLKMLDFPGLCSPEVVAARRRLHTDSFARLIAELRPDWLVLRPREVTEICNEDPLLLSKHFLAVKVFDVSAQLKADSPVPGSRLRAGDETLTVFRRR